jgi:hypothetical protein
MPGEPATQSYKPASRTEMKGNDGVPTQVRQFDVERAGRFNRRSLQTHQADFHQRR